jgi:hypothetical protein
VLAISLMHIKINMPSKTLISKYILLSYGFFVVLYQSKARHPPNNCAVTYANSFDDEISFFNHNMNDIAGLTCAPDILPVRKMTAINAIPIAIAVPSTRITDKKTKVPSNSAINEVKSNDIMYYILE